MIDVAIVLILVGVALGVSRWLRLKLESELAIAVVRAVVQLAAVAALVKLLFENPPYSALFVVAMLAVAAWTSARRLDGVPGRWWVAGAAISAGTGVALGILFGLGVFELTPQFLLPIAGMLIGNSMNATSVAGVLARDEIRDKTQEIDARLALGVTVHYALTAYVRKAVSTSLIPLIDSTKNVGLIFLPGAFVGMIIGGAEPVDAARVQAIVLFMLLGAVAVSAMIAAALVVRSFIAPGERLVVPEALRR